MLGKSTRIDYDLLARLVVGAGQGYSSWKPIPKGSKVEVVISSGTAVDTEFNATVEPDDGYLLALSYIQLTVPSGVEVNVLVETDEGEFPLLAENVTEDTLIDASDFLGLGGLKKVTLYARVMSSPSSDITVTMEYAGRQVRG